MRYATYAQIPRQRTKKVRLQIPVSRADDGFAVARFNSCTVSTRHLEVSHVCDKAALRVEVLRRGLAQPAQAIVGVQD